MPSLKLIDDATIEKITNTTKNGNAIAHIGRASLCTWLADGTTTTDDCFAANVEYCSIFIYNSKKKP